MNILISDLESMINEYEECRELANHFGKIIFLNNEQPDSVLMPISEYERMSQAFETSDKANILDLVKQLPSAGNRKVYSLAQLKYDLNHSHKMQAQH